MHVLRIGLVLTFVFGFGFITADWGTTGEMEQAGAMVPEEQLDNYIEVRQLMSENPALNTEEVDDLLEKHDLSRQQYDSIDQQVQTTPELSEKVEQRLRKEASTQKQAPLFPEVKTKLKEPFPEIPSE